MRLSAFALIGMIAAAAGAQPSGHGHGRSILFLAQADGSEVAPRPVDTGASATAAILIDRIERTGRYDLTYHGLQSGPPRRIGIYNFDRGGVGPLIAEICGPTTEPCPARSEARLTGALRGRPLTPSLLSEFASGRTYIQIDGATPEIRGQLEPNGAMVPVRNYIAELAPRAEGGTGEGTAILSETYLPGGRVAVKYSVTVAGTSGEPQAANLTGVAGSTAPAGGLRFLKSMRLPLGREAFGLRRRGGGSFSGRYIADGAREKSVQTVTGLFAAAATPALTVRTSRFPKGELVGTFKPVN